MRTKPNKYKCNSEHSHWQHNDLYRKFRREFDLLLQGDSPCTKDIDFSLCYVGNKFIEDRLRYIKESTIDSIQFLIGRTGIGKSTVLRYVFKTSRKPIIDNQSLIVPFSFNGMRMSPIDHEEKLGAIIRTASKTILDAFSLDYSNDAFLAFIENHAPDVLMRTNADILESNDVLLKKFRDGDPYSYSLEEFKYFLAKSPLKRAIFVYDDIESESQSVQESIIESMCRLYSCIRNYDDRNARINVLFAIRPVTEKLARKNQAINAFPIARPIIIKKPIPLCDLFQARMEYANRDIGIGHVKNIESWREALSILLDIVAHLSDRYGYGMLKLFNNNIRRTLIEFQYLITNRVWLQKNEKPKASFKINMDDFAINNAAIYRALGMRNGFLYPAEGTCLVNIFWNKPENKYDLIVCYVILYLLERNNGNEYLDAVVDKYEIIENFRRLFIIDDFDSVMNRVFDTMLEFKLIEIEQSNRGEESGLYLTLQPRAQQIWEMLGDTAIVLEMFRDDTYQVFKDRPKKLSTSLSFEELFEDVFCFLREIFKWEKRRVDGFKINNPILARRIFGGASIYEQSLSGIRGQLYAYYQEPEDIPQIFRDKLTEAFDRIKEIKY